MKKILLLSAIFCYIFISAQIKSPQPSPTATITQKVGISNISVEYSRPGVKGREIFGELVPFGKIWRTGAFVIRDPNGIVLNFSFVFISKQRSYFMFIKTAYFPCNFSYRTIFFIVNN